MLNLFDKKINVLEKSGSQNNNEMDERQRKHVDIDFKDFEKKIENTIGDTRHYTPAVKEWSNSIYFYNNNSMKSLPVKHKMVNKLIKSYFNIISPYKIKSMPKRRWARLIRRQTKILRKSAKNLFVSKSELKQTNDKIIITVYILDRAKESLKRRLFLINRSFQLNKALKSIRLIPSLNYTTHFKSFKESALTSNKQSTNILINQKTGFYSKYMRNLLLKKNNITFNKIRPIKSKIKKSNKYSVVKSNKYVVKKSLFKEKLATSILEKRALLKNIFFFSFLKWTLWMFKIKVFFRTSKKHIIVGIKNKNTKLLFLKRNNRFFLSYLKKINNILLHLLVITLKNSIKFNVSEGKNLSNLKEKKIYYLFKYFKDHYYKRFLKKYLRKQVLSLHYLYMFSINNFKFDRFLPGLKLLVSKIFNKKIELNLVNLKYLHLNSDIFSEAVATRLMKKKSNLLLILKRSLKLVKLPPRASSGMFYGDNALKPFNQSFLNRYKALNINSFNFNAKSNELKNGDLLQKVLHTIYSFYNKEPGFSLLNETKEQKNKKSNILNSIKYKWIKGVKVEAKGRLTKRYTASRSVFKIKYKGNLKNIDSINGLSSVMLRGVVRPNVEYAFKKSWRRIGAFGVKGWISSQ
jgi:hypothetical protein